MRAKCTAPTVAAADAHFADFAEQWRDTNPAMDRDAVQRTPPPERCLPRAPKSPVLAAREVFGASPNAWVQLQDAIRTEGRGAENGRRADAAGPLDVGVGDDHLCDG